MRLKTVEAKWMEWKTRWPKSKAAFSHCIHNSGYCVLWQYWLMQSIHSWMNVRLFYVNIKRSLQIGFMQRLVNTNSRCLLGFRWRTLTKSCWLNLVAGKMPIDRPIAVPASASVFASNSYFLFSNKISCFPFFLVQLWSMGRCSRCSDLKFKYFSVECDITISNRLILI